MSNHPSTQLLERYGQRLLEGPELLRLDDHVTSCAECRERLRLMKPGHSALQALRASLQAAPGTAPAHLPPEQLMAYASGQLDEVDRELAESHLEVCRQCAAQTQNLNDSLARWVSNADTSSSSHDLQPSAATLQNRLGSALVHPRPLRRLLTSKWAGAIAALALLLIAVALWLRTHTPTQENVGQSTVPLPSTSQPLVPPSPEAKPPDATVVLTLHDGSEQITLDTMGNFTGLQALSPADTRRVKTALQTGKMLTPETLSELRDSPSARMGAPGGKPAFELLGPVGKVMASDLPSFRWRSLSGATSYRVTITDPALDYKEIAASRPLNDLKWTVDHALERGRIYAWQVIAHTEAGDVKAPEATEAKFKVLDRSIADDLKRARRVYAGRHLVLGLLYAEAGLLDEAERELLALVAANPQSPIAKGLLAEVQSKLRRLQ